MKQDNFNKLRTVALRIAPALTLAVVMIFTFSVPVRALALFDYNDYLKNVVVDGDNDICIVQYPLNWASWLVYPPMADVVTAYGSSSVTWTDPGRSDGSRTGIYLFPFGANYERSLDLSNIPSGTTVSCGISIDNSSVSFNTPTVNVSIEYFNSDGVQIATMHSDSSFVYESGIFKVTNIVLDYPSGAASCNIRYNIQGFSTLAANTRVTMTLVNFEMQFSISSMYRLQQQTGRTNKLLEEVSQKLEEQGQTLDEILSGGSAGDDLIAGNDKLEDAGNGLGDDIGQIQDFENQYFGQLEDSMGDIVGAGDLTFLVAPLSFCQGYLNKIVAGIPSKYMVIFTLPVLFGIFFYVVQHPIKAPRPDTSGDQVTRETFTTTTVLSGKHAGQSTTTRTVTTSQEIGRVHRE